MNPSDAPDGSAAHLSVFFSYARADEARVRSIIGKLEARGFDVWWDGRLQGGSRYAREIERALETADAVVVAWSNASLVSDWVRDEAAHGRDRGRLAPIAIDPVEPPLGFRQYQTLDFSGRKGDLDRSLDQLEEAILLVAGAPPPAPTTKPGPRPDRRTLMLAGGGASALALAAGGLWLARGLGGPPLDERCVAVVPFANLSSDPQQTYFSEGLSEDIRSRLARNPALKVLGEITCRQFGQRNADGQKLARSLGVGLILSGSVRKGGDAIRVAAELTDVATGVVRWTQTFDRPLVDVFAVQNDIAAAVNDALANAVVRPPPAATRPAGGTKNVEAYEAVLRGGALDRLDQEEAEYQALAAFDHAIALDPGYAAAHAGRARALSGLAFSYAKGADVPRLFEKAVESARRAIALAPDLADAQSTLGMVCFYGQLNARAAVEPFERARALGPAEPATLTRFAAFAAKTGRYGDADAAIEKAITLDPLNALMYRNRGTIRLAERRFADALQPLRKALELNGKMSATHGLTALALFGLGRLDEAEREAALETVPMFRLSAEAVIRNRRGDRAGAGRALAELVRTAGDSALYQQAQVLAQFGDGKGALDRLEKARRAADSGLTGLKVDFLLDPVRSDSRFKALALSIGLA